MNNNKFNMESQSIDNYKLEKDIQPGTVSTVYKGICKRNGQKVAIRVIEKEGMDEED
jgi:serine/threonine protein kinase